jgi:hypothetical protein
MYKAERTGFAYEAVSDSYTCSQGKLLPVHKVLVDSEGHAEKRYLAKAATASAAQFVNSIRARILSRSAYN